MKPPAHRRRRARTALAPCLLLLSLALAACESDDGAAPGTVADTAATTADSAPPADPVTQADPVAQAGPGTQAEAAQLNDAFPPLPSDLNDFSQVHRQDGYGRDEVTRLDVRTLTVPGVCDEDDESGCTLADIIADTNSNDRFKPDIAVHLSADALSGPALDDPDTANAQLRQRGGFTRFAPQKSFRLRMDDKSTLWRGERKLLLNKHPYDDDRIRNALSMELLASVPHLIGSRTAFTNLWIDDGAGAKDYGLFTQVEAPGKRWLKRRGLDESGRLYKPELFRFAAEERDALATDETGEPLDSTAFEYHLEIEAGDDHRPLTRLMDALHDPQRSFESVLDEHFNRNNLQAWLAMNILLHQIEAVSHNYLLYNPAGSERFYFVPWDYDATFAIEPEPASDASDVDALRARLRYGYARNKPNVVIRRFLQLPGAHERMLAAVTALQERHLGPDSVSARADAMAASVAPWLQRLPDNENRKQRDALPGAAFLASIDGNAQALRTRFAIPMPPTLLEPRVDAGQASFAWTPAFEVTGSALSYQLQVSRAPAFAPGDIVASVSDIADAPDRITHDIDAQALPAGTLYVRVTARSQIDPSRFWQVADNVLEQDGQRWPGVLSFRMP